MKYKNISKNKIEMIKYDPISLLIYIIIIIIIYFVLAFILKILELYFTLPIFYVFNEYVLNHPFLIIPKIIYYIIYSTQVIVFLSIVLSIIIIILLVLYVIRFILLFMIPVFPIPIGIIMYYAIPPFVQLDEAGIFKLIDNIFEAIFKNIPFLGKIFINITKTLITFSKDKFVDLVKETNPDVELDKSQFNKVFIERFMNQDNSNNKDFKEILKDSKIIIKEYIEKFEENTNKKSNFYNKTKIAMNKTLEAESYKSYDSSLPSMSIIEIMTTALNNRAKSFTTKVSNIGDDIKLETSKTAD